MLHWMENFLIVDAWLFANLCSACVGGRSSVISSGTVSTWQLVSRQISHQKWRAIWNNVLAGSAYYLAGDVRSRHATTTTTTIDDDDKQ